MPTTHRVLRTGHLAVAPRADVCYWAVAAMEKQRNLYLQGIAQALSGKGRPVRTYYEGRASATRLYDANRFLHSSSYRGATVVLAAAIEALRRTMAARAWCRVHVPAR
jgi:hypothetical protein